MSSKYDPLCDFYNLLGVSVDASRELIIKAHRSSIRRYHPDLHGNDARNNEIVRRLNVARDVLADPRKRQQYDSERAAYLSYRVHFSDAGVHGRAGAYSNRRPGQGDAGQNWSWVSTQQGHGGVASSAVSRAEKGLFRTLLEPEIRNNMRKGDLLGALLVSMLSVGADIALEELLRR